MSDFNNYFKHLFDRRQRILQAAQENSNARNAAHIDEYEIAALFYSPGQSSNNVCHWRGNFVYPGGGLQKMVLHGRAMVTESDDIVVVDQLAFVFDFDPAAGYELLSAAQFQPKAKPEFHRPPPKKDVWWTSGCMYFDKGKFYHPGDYTRSPHLWHARESFRLANGTYKPLPDAIYTVMGELLDWRQIGQINLTFPHVAMSDASMIAFTESPQKGYADRQTTTRPGKYFGRFTDDQKVIKQLSSVFNVADKIEGFTFHKLSDDDCEISIKELYCESGISSCMSYGSRHFNTEGDHPVEAYCLDDFDAVFIRDREGGIKARAMVNIKDKTYQSTYSYDDWSQFHSALQGHLALNGYTSNRNWAEGLRLHRLPVGGSFVGPYIDGENHDIFDDGEWLWVGVKDGDWAGTCHASHEHSGLISDEDYEECNECDNRVDEDSAINQNGDRICDNCREYHHVYSAYHDAFIRDDEAVSTICEGYAHESECIQMDRGASAGEYCIEGNDFYTELGNGELISDDDLDETVETHDGTLAMREDCVELLSEEYAIEDEAEYIDALDGYELTGIWFDEINLEEDSLPVLAKLHYVGHLLPSSKRFIVYHAGKEPKAESTTLEQIKATCGGEAFHLCTDHVTRYINQ